MSAEAVQTAGERPASDRAASLGLRALQAGPVLILAAIENAVLEEVIVVGYLITRLRSFGLRLPMMITSSALLRGSYHLYQGFGAFVGFIGAVPGRISKSGVNGPRMPRS